MDPLLAGHFFKFRNCPQQITEVVPHCPWQIYRDLTLITRDGFSAVIAQMQFLIMEKYTKLLESAKQQLLWLLREMIR